LIHSGVLGEVTKYEIEWNYHWARWRGRPEVKMIREQDTDWPAWLMSKSSRPFDPQLYFEFRLYKEFSSGISDQWMSHNPSLHCGLAALGCGPPAPGGPHPWKSNRSSQLVAVI
jgi:hypothetical protein